MMGLTLAHLAASRAAIDTLRDLGVTLTPDDEMRIKNGLFSPIRAAMIREDWREHLPGQGETEGQQTELADKYCCSVNTVRAIIGERR